MSVLVSAVTGFVSGALGSIVAYRFLIRPRLPATDGTDGLSVAVAELEGRLDALRNGRPVPLEILHRPELEAFGKQTVIAATDERFTWKGKGKPAEFVFDRPEPGRPTLVRISVQVRRTGYGRAAVVGVERTEQRIRELSTNGATSKKPGFAVIPPPVTHLRVEPTDFTTWVVTALPHDLLPTTESAMRGKGPMAFYHRGGAVPVVFQAQGEGGHVEFYPDCDCPEVCQDDWMHRGSMSQWWSDFLTVTAEYRESGKLPEKAGVIIVDVQGTWSFDIVDPDTAA